VPDFQRSASGATVQSLTLIAINGNGRSCRHSSMMDVILGMDHV
jgi:hypothetical protein